jgi:hypothetical protein
VAKRREESLPENFVSTRTDLTTLKHTTTDNGDAFRAAADRAPSSGAETGAAAEASNQSKRLSILCVAAAGDGRGPDVRVSAAPPLRLTTHNKPILHHSTTHKDMKENETYLPELRRSGLTGPIARAVPVLFAVATLLFSPIPAKAQLVTLANPHWNISLTDYGYSDFLLDNTPGFEGREYLSGEWGAAIGYQPAGEPMLAPRFLEPMFLFPDWATLSPFKVKSPLAQIGLNADTCPLRSPSSRMAISRSPCATRCSTRWLARRWASPGLGHQHEPVPPQQSLRAQTDRHDSEYFQRGHHECSVLPISARLAIGPRRL